MAVDVEQIQTKLTVAERVAIANACQILMGCKQLLGALRSRDGRIEPEALLVLEKLVRDATNEIVTALGAAR